jgi:hypothetical protein
VYVALPYVKLTSVSPTIRDRAARVGQKNPRVHFERRRDAARVLQEAWQDKSAKRRSQAVTDSGPTLAAMAEWDLREFRALRSWLCEHWRVLL